ncbi:hypothetical protein IGI04_020312, partial [Brassica rapa subsp. trilocularis]
MKNVSVSKWSPSNRVLLETSVGILQEEDEAAEAEVLERWPEKDNFKECQCHKRGPMAHRVKSGKRKKLNQK